MIFSLKIKLNYTVAGHCRGIGMCLWCCWKDLDEQGFNGIYSLRFGFMWEILIFKQFLLLKIQINSKQTRFWKEKSVEGVLTLGPTT
jgi:hypothetical protein